MKIKGLVLALIAFNFVLMTSCEGTVQTPPKAVAQETEDEAVITEPTQSKEAQEKLQFALPKAGDRVAEIVVKGYGSILVKLFDEIAPKAVNNFVTHSENGYYNGTLFHRVAKDFMIQGGDPKGDGTGGESIYGAPFEDEISEDLLPVRGALCMANSGEDTNASQFFIVQADDTFVKSMKEMVEYKKYDFLEYLESGYLTKITQEQLDSFLTYGGTPWLYGHHTVFGQVYEGFDVLDKIASVETNEENRPLQSIEMTLIRVFRYEE